MGTITANQISNMNMIYKNFTFDYFLDSMDRLGFKTFELWAGSPHFCNTDADSDPVPEMRRKLQERGFKVTCLTGEQCSYPANIGAREPEVRERSIAYFTKIIRQAAELGADKYLMSIGWGYYDETVDEAWKRGVDAGAQILKVAEQEKVNILWEIIVPYATSLINGFESSRRILKDLDSPYSRLCVDTVPVFYEHKKLEDYLREFGDKVYHIHLNDGAPDGHLTWGDGVQPLEEHLQALAKYNYTGTITLEVGNPMYMRDPELAVRQGFNNVKKYLPLTV